MTIISPGSAISYRSFMMFIDGAYLRNEMIEKHGTDDIRFDLIPTIFALKLKWGSIDMEIIRAYYYDAVVDFKDNAEKHNEQETYFNNLRELNHYEVKLGRLIKTGKDNKKYRQKGVDVLLAIDMISKAHLNHYDIALLLAGDDDYLDLVHSIKNLTGKRIYGAYFERNASRRLIESFDRRIPITDDIVRQFLQRDDQNDRK